MLKCPLNIQIGYIMERHASIIKLGVDLGYFKDESGACDGIITAWIEACFCNEEDVFNKRVDKILNLIETKSFIEQISAIKEKVKSQSRLTERTLNKKLSKNTHTNTYSSFFWNAFQRLKCTQIELLDQEESPPLAPQISLFIEEMEVLDVVAFFEKVSLYQNPDKDISLFNELLKQCDKDEISQIISSDKILAQGGITRITPYISIYTVEELNTYLSNIANAIKESNPFSNDEVAVLINTSNHTMALLYETYNKIIPCWKFMDINSSKTALISINDIKNVVEFIQINYYDQKDKYLVLGKSAITTGKNPYKNDLIKHINLVQASNLITPEKLESKSEGLPNWFHLTKQALSTGNITILSQLSFKTIEESLFIETVHPRALIYLIEQGYNPSYILIHAAKLSLLNVIEACIAKKINLDIPFKQYTPSPLFMAALHGNLEVLHVLHNNGVQLNKLSPQGYNIAHYAAMNGQHNVIAWLGAHQPELLKQKNDNQETPAELAIKKGYEMALREIIKWNNPSIDEWNKFLFIAAGENHAHLIPLFLSQGIDLNQLDPESGYGPVHIAAFYGYLEFLSGLIEQEVDLSIENKEGKTPLMLAQMPSYPRIKNKSPEIIAKMISIIENQLDKNQSRVFQY